MNVRSALLTLWSLELVSEFRLDSILRSIKQRNYLTPSVESSSPHSYSKTSVSNYVFYVFVPSLNFLYNYNTIHFETRQKVDSLHLRYSVPYSVN